MKKMILFSLVIAVLLLAGCGSTRKEIERLRTEQEQGLKQVRDQIGVLGGLLSVLQDEFSQLDSEVFELRSRLEYGPVGIRTARGPETTGGETESTASPLDRHVERVPVQPIEATDLQSLATEVAKLRADVETLRLEFAAEKEIVELSDPRKTWEAMNDPEKLTWRLDRFERVWSRTIEDDAKRDDFVADLTAVKEQINLRAAMSTAELLEHYREQLRERANTEGNERVRRYFEQQLRGLETGNEKFIEGHLQTYQRYDFAEDLRILASKYNITMDQLRDNGLQTYGSPHGWQSSR